MKKAVILDTLKKLGSLKQVEICILVRKNGDIVASAGHDIFIQLETFGIMSATIFGAANTANEHLEKESPDRIVIRSGDGDTVIKGVDNDLVMVIRTHGRKNFGKILNKMDNAIKHIRKNMGS